MIFDLDDIRSLLASESEQTDGAKRRYRSCYVGTLTELCEDDTLREDTAWTRCDVCLGTRMVDNPQADAAKYKAARLRRDARKHALCAAYGAMVNQWPTSKFEEWMALCQEAIRYDKTIRCSACEGTGEFEAYLSHPWWQAAEAEVAELGAELLLDHPESVFVLQYLDKV